MMKRKDAERLLHFSHDMSYRAFAPVKGAWGMVSVRKACDFLRNLARNGAEVGNEIPPDLVTVQELAPEIGMSVRSAFRFVKRRLPHFFVSKKVVLVSRSAISDCI